MPKPGSASRAADDAEPNFAPQLVHATRTHSYNPTYYGLMQPNVDACGHGENTGAARGGEIGKAMGPYAVW